LRPPASLSLPYPPLFRASDAFPDGESIPARFTCDGEDVSPALKWQGVPDEAQSLTLIVDDPDAPGGTYTHWLIYNIRGQARALPDRKSTRLNSSHGSISY